MKSKFLASSLAGISLLVGSAGVLHASETQTARGDVVAEQVSPVQVLQPVSHLETFSVEMVVRAQDVPATQAIYSETGVSGQVLVTPAEKDGKLRIQVLEAGAEKPLVDHVSNQVVFDGQLRHVVFSVDQGVGSIYINGQLDSTFPYKRLPGALAQAQSQPAIGLENAEVMTGDLRQVTVRTQPLSVEQIRLRAEQVQEVAASLGLTSYADAGAGVTLAQADVDNVTPGEGSTAQAGGGEGAGGAGGGAGGAAGGTGGALGGAGLTTTQMIVGGAILGGVGGGIALAGALSGSDSGPRSPTQP